MIPAQMSDFISKVGRSTDKGELKWSREPGLMRDVYICSHNEYQLRISLDWVEDEERTYVFFSVTLPDGNDASFSVSNYDEDYIQMRGLYELATISAANINPDSLMGFFKT